ncbi:MAG: hypothetical protein LBE91_19595 [Tannerella sp.]|nr:hypothetical protein [Tannerella sp.]
MKNLSVILLLVMALFTGCREEEGSLRIDSLSVDGNEFYSFQRIKMWMAVESDNLGMADYEWGCDAGYFSEGQGISEATWIPPGETGEYQVWCKITVGNKTETRYRTMNVSHYFFDYFEHDGTTAISVNTAPPNVRSRPLTWTGVSNLTRTVTPATKSCVISASGATATTGLLTKPFTDPDLKMPFSCMATIGWNANMPAEWGRIGDSLTYSLVPNLIGYGFALSRDLDAAGLLYVSNVWFEWFPRGTNMGQIDSGSGEWCNGRFYFMQSGVGATTVAGTEWFYHPALLSGAGEYKKVAFSITNDYTVVAYVNGTKVFETDALKNWRSANNYTGNFNLTSWAIEVPNGSGDGVTAPAATTVPTIYLANTVGQNNGYVYTGVEEN